jgi:DNA-binding MarR family transcriptional regulator
MTGSDSPGARPTPLKYRSELVAILADLQGVWDSPRFQSGIAHSRRRDFGAIEVRILWTLARRGPLRSSALAALLVTGAPTISKAIVKLTASGLVRRDVDTSDGRAHTVALTDAGVEAAQDLYDAGDDMIAELLADWPAEEAGEFTRFARRFLEQTVSYATRLPAS